MYAKSKIHLGNKYNKGKIWRPEGSLIEVDGHDFIFPSQKVNLYGVYDLDPNSGFSVLRTDYDTSAFAVSCLRK
jgi:hypothetical protein